MINNYRDIYSIQYHLQIAAATATCTTYMCINGCNLSAAHVCVIERPDFYIHFATSAQLTSKHVIIDSFLSFCCHSFHLQSNKKGFAPLIMGVFHWYKLL